MNRVLDKLSLLIITLPRFIKRLIATLTDISICVLTVWASFLLRLGEFPAFNNNLFIASFVSILVAIPIFAILGFYRAIFRYSGWPALINVTKAVITYGIIYVVVFAFIGIEGVPRTIGFIQPILLFLIIGASRILVRAWLGKSYHNILRKIACPRVLIYGAGSAGIQLLNTLANSYEMRVVGFLDDDPTLHGRSINGQTVYNPNELIAITKKLDIHKVLLAIPRAGRKQRNIILDLVQNAEVKVQSLPNFADLLQGKLHIGDLKDLDDDDLLGREPVLPNIKLLEKNVKEKIVLVTGAGGSIGGEICRQIILCHPTKILLVEQSEYALYSIHQELIRMLHDKEEIILIPLLASVQNYDRIYNIIKTWKPSTIYHAAAYKHVPLVEHNPFEGIKNNVYGTLNIVECADKHRVDNFVFISTDKAVRPTNIMGCTKRLAEMILQAFANEKVFTKFSIVRFGNVLGSSGSVVPKFRQQIQDGGPITLTNSEIVRYFMSVSEAAQLTIQAGALANGGDVFVLDMGEPIKIYELATRMVRLSGLAVKDLKNPNGDIEIIVTGLRPGEKLYEELLIGSNPESTLHPKILKAHDEFIPWSELKSKLYNLESALVSNNVHETRKLLIELVPEYSPIIGIVDWIYIENNIG